jgi:hypothetical protein
VAWLGSGTQIPDIFIESLEDIFRDMRERHTALAYLELDIINNAAYLRRYGCAGLRPPCDVPHPPAL